MTQEERDRITKERLDVWDQEFAKRMATPVMMLGVCHGEHSGTLLIETCKEVTQWQLLKFLEFSAAEIRRGLQGRS